jgi:large subunit ribosomal protein L28
MESAMSRKCCVTGKKPGNGFKYSIRGIAKKQKGIGLKVTGKTRRRHNPNLVKKRLWLAEENRFVTLKLSMHALRIIDKQGLGSVVKEMRARGEKI